MEKLVLTVVRAKFGDSLIVEGDGARLLIDGGPKGVFNNFLRPVLEDIPPQDNGEPAAIDLMMISHIDSDHIAGILDLTSLLLKQRQSQERELVTIRSAWHNSFADMVGGTGVATNAAKAAAAEAGGALEFLLGAERAEHGSKLVLQSVAEGRSLRLDLEALAIEANAGFTDQLVSQMPGNPAFQSAGQGLKVFVVGPTGDELAALREKWAKELPEILKKQKSAVKAEVAAAAKLAEDLDTSVHNLSSIVCVVELGKKRMLLTGDARGDMIMRWLVDTGYLKKGGTVKFDLVKLPHHGSNYNVSPEFFKTVLADHYVISGDGNYENPEPVTLDMLFTARPKLDYRITLTYSPDQLKAHPKFIASGRDTLLDQVLADPKRAAVLSWPDDAARFISVAI